MKGRFFKNITAFIMVILIASTLAFTASAVEAESEAEIIIETETEYEGETESETFTVNGVEIPKFDFITKPYLNIADANIPLDKIREAFNIMPEFKYENGKYMVSDIGADKVELYNNTDYEYLKMTLEDGYWVVEISEEEIKNPELVWNVYVKSIENNWEMYYHNEEPNRRVQFCTDFNTYSVAVYIDTEDDWADVTYLALDRPCQDSYRDGLLTEHKVIRMFDDQDDWFSVAYNPDKTVNHVVLWYDADATYYYLIPEQGWYDISQADPDYKVDTPAGYEDKDIEYFVSFAPCIINCAHENLIPATCEEPAVCSACGIVPDGSEALGHDMVTDESVDPTCTETGLTEGSHCSRCDAMTTPQIEVPELGHNYIGGVCERCGDEEIETDSNTETEIVKESETETADMTESKAEDEMGSETAAVDKNIGCGSSIGMGAIAIVTAFGAAIIFKKKN